MPVIDTRKIAPRRPESAHGGAVAKPDPRPEEAALGRYARRARDRVLVEDEPGPPERRTFIPRTEAEAELLAIAETIPSIR